MEVRFLRTPLDLFSTNHSVRGVLRPLFPAIVDTSRLSPPKFYKRLLSGSGSRQGFRSTRTSRKPNETLDITGRNSR